MAAIKKPSELLREKLEKRAQDQLALINKITPKHLQKTPSQKRSEAGRYQSDPNHEDFVDEIPLYCSCHSTEEGRHSATRRLPR